MKELQRLLRAILSIALVLSAVCRVAFAAEFTTTTTAASASTTATSSEKDLPRWGMSHHGSHYDEGPRSKPILMDGIGNTHFPVTSSHTEVQEWFDQGHTLLHSFWPFEAERSFRWCIKLDPDCAMAYWGLSRCCEADDNRAAKFLQEAVDRKELVSDREREYIELWVAKSKVKKAKLAATQSKEDENAQSTLKKTKEDYVVRFDKLLMDYPNDIEARALYWLELPRTLNDDAQKGLQAYRFAMESVLQEVLRKDPNHVGALHYRVHNWDSREGKYALDSCLRLSDVAPNSGHLQHMPGHVLSGIGLWHEAAIAMDSATRVEKEYMYRNMIRPDQNWNYMHNLNYLCFIQEQLGMYDAAMVGVQQMGAGPQAIEGPALLANMQVNLAALRLLIKAERWIDLLDAHSSLFNWNQSNPIDRFLKGYGKTHALIATGKLDEAEKKLQQLKDPSAASVEESRFGRNKPADSLKDEKKKDAAPTAGPPAELIEKFLGNSIKLQELEGKLLLAQGNHLDGIEKLTAAAKAQAENWMNDPPTHPMFLYNTLGDAYLEGGSPQLAIPAYQKTLETIANDGIALSGLVRAHAALGEVEEARASMAKLNAVWSEADQPNRRLKLALATGVKAKAKLGAEIVERSFKKEVLDKKGHSLWTPPMAPSFSALDSSGHI
ncbi:MAG: tetratricopeptide repeat protein, partial [Planctomycetales bacterium]|nr:tetratricopeptide repeat protein [Planctomycetales bacterium]